MFWGRKYCAAALVVASAGIVMAGCGSSKTVTTTSTTAAAAVKVQVMSPANGTVIDSSNVTIRGTVVPSNATVEINGKPAAVGNGVFTGNAHLQRGKTRIDVIASSSSQSPGSTSVTITRPKPHKKHKKATTVASASSTTSTPGATPAVAYAPANSGVPTNTSTCGGGLSVGPDTSCAFAQNVENDFESAGAGTYTVFSPVTNQTYSMTCNPAGNGTLVSCTGGNDATVYFTP